MDSFPYGTLKIQDPEELLNYFGMKLHLLIDLKGVPMAWELTAASIDDRSIVEKIIPLDPIVQKGGRIRVWTDNGYESEDLKEEVEEKGNTLNAFPKKKDYLKWPKWLRHWIRSERQKVETKFSAGKRFVNLETPKAATTEGLMARMTAKITVLTLYMFSGVLSLIAQSQF